MSKNKFDFEDCPTKVFEKEIEVKNIKNQTPDEERIKVKFDKTIQEIQKNFSLIDIAKDDDLNIYENLLRGQILFLFGTVDLYMHDIILESYMKIIYELKKPGSELDKISIKLINLIDFVQEEEKNKKREILENSLREFNDYKTYLSNKHIMQSLKSISNKGLYKKVYTKLNLTQNSFKNKLNDYYKRRNLIAHQFDFNIKLNKQTPITKEEVVEMIDFYKKFIDTLHKIIINDI